MPPNVLLIVLDTARADAFEPYGAAAGASPVVADLARRGAAAPQAYATCNWTMPSHVSLFTGALPRTLGLCRAPGGNAANVRPVLEANAQRLLAEVLRRAGYETRAVSSNPWIAEHAGFSLGFEEFHYADTMRRRRIHDPSFQARLAWALEAVAANVDDGAAEAERIVRSWVAEEHERPFFWFVNLIECHSPYMPPRPYNDLSFLKRLRVGEEARRYLTLHGILRACAGGFDVPADALERMRHLYGREIRLLDDWIGRVLEAMDRRRLLDDTLVLVTSDHGENLGEGRLIGHAFSLDQRLIKVPLVAAGPGAKGFDGVVSIAAVPRLIADAAGLGDHPWRQDAVPDGVAVAQYDAMADLDDPRITQVRAWGLGEEGVRRFTTSRTCATDGSLKLERFGDELLLYDLDTDPLEVAPRTVNGSTDPRVERLREALRTTEASERPQAEDLGIEADDAADLEERMRLLGYL